MAEGKSPLEGVSDKKRRKVITLDQKIEIITRYERGESKTKISRDMRMNESTIRTILNRKDEYKEKGKLASPLESMHIARHRSIKMIEMERLLSLWIEDCNQKQIPLSTMSIKMKALSLFASLNEKTSVRDDRARDEIKTEVIVNDTETVNKEGAEESFSASSGWFARFKIRAGLHSVRITGENASGDKDAIVKYFKVLKTEEGGSTEQQVTNVDETGLFWKRMSTKTFLSKREIITPNLNCDNDDDASVQQVKEVTFNELGGILRAGEVLKQKIMHVDPNIERSIEIRQNIDKVLNPYKQIYEDKKKENSVETSPFRHFSSK